MSPIAKVEFRQLLVGDVALFRKLLVTFGDAFEEPDVYRHTQPSDAYLQDMLGSNYFIAVAALQGAVVIGGLAGYELKKFEQERSEIYVYDLAVAKAHRRKGVATGLFAHLGEIAKSRGAYVIFVQADKTDPPAIALYTKLGLKEEVLHFDIAVK